MKRILPSAGEIGLFAGVSVLCAIIVSRFFAMDDGLAVLAVPLFVGACVMGLRKNGHFARREPVPVPVEADDE